MPTFALITEGLTDQIVLEHLIEQIFEGDIFINPLQPLRDATDEWAAPHGGWELVLEYCEQRAADALATNDYVVVQIDTDEGDHPNFGISLTHDGRDRHYSELISDTKAILAQKIDANLYHENIDRFIFAICVHSIESWILLYLFNLDEPKNSLNRINGRFHKGNVPPLSKTARRYTEVSRDIKLRRLRQIAGQTNSFGEFLSNIFTVSQLEAEKQAQ